jgi:hypothetical protein
VRGGGGPEKRKPVWAGDATPTLPRSRWGRSLLRIAAFAAGALTAAAVAAQDLEPREYANLPVGLNFLIAGYVRSEGGVSADASVPLEDAEIEVDGAVLGYARSLDVWGRSGKVSVVLPYAWLEGSARVDGEIRERHVDGLGDPSVRFSVNLLGAPAMSLEEFARYEQDIIVGASVRVTAPLGRYDSDKLVNLGTHRWSIKPEVGISKAWRRWTVELAGAVAFFTDNDDFRGGRTREQEPLYSVQGHVIYSFGRGIWGALDATWYSGGETRIDGVERDDRQENTRVGATLSLPVSRRHSVKLYATAGVSARIGTDFDTLGIAWQYRWGAGL